MAASATTRTKINCSGLNSGSISDDLSGYYKLFSASNFIRFGRLLIQSKSGMQHANRKFGIFFTNHT